MTRIQSAPFAIGDRVEFTEDYLSLVHADDDMCNAAGTVVLVIAPVAYTDGTSRPARLIIQWDNDDGGPYGEPAGNLQLVNPRASQRLF